MDISDDIDFDEWYDLFFEHVKAAGYLGDIDKYEVEAYYDEGNTPEYAGIRRNTRRNYSLKK